MTLRLDPLLDRQRSRNVDATLISRGVAGVILMENAGRSAAEAILRLARERGSAADALSVVFAGPGNNGGDGYVVARHLHRAGWNVTVASIVDPSVLRGDAAIMRDAWLACGGSVISQGHALDPERLGDLVDPDTWVIDAMFGTGLVRPLDGLARAIAGGLRAIEARVPRVALDLPSGLDADRGCALGDEDGVFAASHTLAFGTSKPGLHTGFGRVAAGDVEVCTLGVALRDDVLTTDSFRIAGIRVSPRSQDAHKGTAGRVLVVGGSAGTTGAALLAARGAHRGGAGLVTVASRASQSIDARVLETMSLALDSDGAVAAATLRENAARADALVVGPGLGRDAWADVVLDETLRARAPLVIDADALSLLAARGGFAHRPATVLTPHPLELARLLGHGEATTRVQADRWGAAREAATKFGAVVVLKGAGTIVATPDGDAYVCDIGESVLAVGGSGDVLAGVIAARLADRSADAPSFERVVEAVFAHAVAGRRVRERLQADRGAMASEIADAIPVALMS